jgi:hypothetical protein
MTDLVVPVSVTVFAAFGIAYGWFLHSAVDRSLYKITGMMFLDSYVLSWVFGLLSAFTPMLFYLAFGFREFADTDDGQELQRRLQWAARLQLLYLALGGAIVLITVPQK